MTEDKIVELVRHELQEHHPGGVTLGIGPGPIRRRGEYWYVPILPTKEPPKMFEYYEALAEVEATLEEDHDIQVLLVPVTPEETVPADEEAAAGEGGM